MDQKLKFEIPSHELVMALWETAPLIFFSTKDAYVIRSISYSTEGGRREKEKGRGRPYFMYFLLFISNNSITLKSMIPMCV